jgi:hypothetical protein
MPRKRKPQYVYEVQKQMNNLLWLTEAFFKTEEEAVRLVEILEVNHPPRSMVDKPFRIHTHEIKNISDFENNS